MYNGEQSSTNIKYTFQVDDLDFSDYDTKQLAYLCDHRLFVRSRYPKLIFSLVHHPKFIEWIRATPEVQFETERDKVTCVVEAVRLHCINRKGELVKTNITLEDTTFWQTLVEQCWKFSSQDKSPESNVKNHQILHTGENKPIHEQQILHRVHRTLKPYRYWANDIPRNESSGSTKGKVSDNRIHELKRTGTTRKKVRSVWID